MLLTTFENWYCFCDQNIIHQFINIMRFRRNYPTVNAGSMADIAFLLLIFFLVTTTISSDKGILRKLPTPCSPNENCNTKEPERNVLRILVNDKQEIMIEDEIVDLTEVKQIAKDFLDNNLDGICNYCNGKQLLDASDNPKKAVISLQHHALTKYYVFINVQDELTQAYYELREEFAKAKYNKPVEKLSKEELREIKEAYPFILSEAKTIREK